MRLLKRLLLALGIFFTTFFILLYSVFFIITNDNHKPYIKTIEKYSSLYKVEKELVFSVIKAESSFRERVESGVGAVGLMQIMPDTAKWIASKLDIKSDDYDMKNPDDNIKFGTFYLSYLIGRFKSIDYAIMAYNAGPSNVQSWIDANESSESQSQDIEIPFLETKKYHEKVKSNYLLAKKVYEFYYDTDSLRFSRAFKIMIYLTINIFR